MSNTKKHIKPWEELTIADDYMFKLVMRHPHICKRLIEKILKIKIKHITYLDDEKTLKFRYDGKGVRLDVYVEGDGTIYEIEMQVRDYGDKEMAYRARYYQSMIDVESLPAGTKHYNKLKNSFIIFICPFTMFDKKRHMYTFRNLCIQDDKIELDDGSTKIFLCAGGSIDDVSPDIKAFLDYIKGSSVKDDFVNEIDEYIQEIKINKEERVSYMTFEMKMMEAREDGLIEVAIAMLRDNKPLEEIIKYTGLPKEHIQELAKQVQWVVEADKNSLLLSFD